MDRACLISRLTSGIVVLLAITPQLALAHTGHAHGRDLPVLEIGGVLLIAVLLISLIRRRPEGLDDE